MAEIRVQLLQDVRDAIESGEVSCFMDYQRLLLEHDTHDPVLDGMTHATSVVHDESSAHQPLEFGEGCMEDQEVISKEAEAFDTGASDAWEDSIGGLQLAVGSSHGTGLDSSEPELWPPIPVDPPPPLPPASFFHPSPPLPASSSSSSSSSSMLPVQALLLGVQPLVSSSSPCSKPVSSADIAQALANAADSLHQVGRTRLAAYVQDQLKVHCAKERHDPYRGQALRAETAKRKHMIEERRRDPTLAAPIPNAKHALCLHGCSRRSW